MSTLKLKKPAAKGGAPKGREPVRAAGVKRVHPTLAQAQAERAVAAAKTRTRRNDDGPPRGPRDDRRDGPQARMDRPPGRRPVAPTTPQQPRAATPPSEPLLPRLSKRMSELGLASRREADEWIEQGFVKVDGQIVDQLGTRVRLDQQIEIDPAARNAQAQRVTVLLHKPLGVVSGQAEDDHTPAIALITAANRWSGDASKQRFNASQLRHLVPAGRLDLDSTGLLVLTQDGRIAKQLIGADSLVEKEYVVRVDWPGHPDTDALSQTFPPELIERMRHGLEIDGERLKPAKVSWQNERQLRVVLREGKKRQIRRMCELVGLRVVALRRIRIGRVGLGELPPGQWRYLAPYESFL